MKKIGLAEPQGVIMIGRFVIANKLNNGELLINDCSVEGNRTEGRLEAIFLQRGDA